MPLPQGTRLEADLVYAQRGDTEMHADLVVPSGPGPFPVVVLVHGGGWRSGDKSLMRPYAASLAARGLATFAIDYRLAPKHHHPAALEDCRDAVRWIRTHAQRHSLDAARVGGWGYSAGAHLVALLATTGNERGGVPIAAAVVVAAPTELAALASPETGTLQGNLLVPPYIGKKPNEAPNVYRAASPLTHVDAGDPPFFVAHGTDDVIVPITQAETFVAALERSEVPVEFFRAERTGHADRTPEIVRAISAATDFVTRRLSAPPAAGRETKR